jgi:hypothetical protein
MKISSNTIAVLKNFASVNASISVKPGSKLKTLSPQNNIMAEASVAEKFERPFAIYDLSQFLGAVSLFGEEADFQFENTHLTLKAGNRSLRYYYAEAGMVKAADKNIHLPSVDVEFDLSEKQLNEILKAASILGVAEIIVSADDANEPIKVSCLNSKNNTSNSYAVDVGANAERKFRAVLKVDNLKMISGDYHVEICCKGLSHFVNSKLGVDYYVALEASSQF